MLEVIKLGGSLLSDVSWPARFALWRRSREDAPAILIVGGGQMIDAMRHLDAVHRLDNETMHWRCVRMLRHTADVAAELLRQSGVELSLLTTLAELAEFVGRVRNGTAGPPTLSLAYADAVYRDDFAAALACLPEHLRQHVRGEPEPPLPQIGWQTTTDAIAIHLAARCGAARCVILKNCPVDSYRDLAGAAAAGVVDAEAPRLAAAFPNVSIVRL